ncbi:MAG: hypothetical protein ACRDWE_11900, partial [Acidimicrobiales bacterium]
GHLPIFDPYIWSGAPLLAGWNAGAAYPLTWLFVMMPATAAWTLNVVAIALVAGVTMFAFLRACRLCVVASFLAALTFAFGGAMSAQVQHLGLVIGMSWVPLGLHALLRLTEPGRPGWRRRLGWTAVLAVAVALVILAGEPRAVANAGAVLGVYALWRLVRLARHAQLFGRRPVGDARASATSLVTSSRTALATSPATAAWSAISVVAGSVIGFGLGAVQLVPGLAAVASSQRAAVTQLLYSAGSFPPHWLTLFGVPDLLGGSGSFGQPVFFATYNLAEVTAYVGIIPLVAAAALLARRRWRPLPEYLVWHVVAIVGLLLALATHTPLGHLFFHIPLLGGQRLQSRSIMVTDLALAVLLAYWADKWLRAPPASRPRRAELWFGVPVALSVALVALVALVWRVPFLEWAGLPAATARAESGLGPWLVPFLVLALLAAALLVMGVRLPRTARATAVLVFVCVDLVVFSATTVVSLTGTAPAPSVQSAAPGPSAPHTTPARGVRPRRRGSTTRTTRTAGSARTTGTAPEVTVSSTVRPIATLHLPGRFAIYDPTLLDGAQLGELGPNDANVVAGTYSVEGYGSIVYGPYAAATGSHGLSGAGQDVFAPRAADDGVLDALDTSDVFVPSPYLALPRGTTTPAGAVGTGKRTTPAGGTATWFLGTPMKVTAATLAVRTRAGPHAPPVLPQNVSAPTLHPRIQVRIGLVEPTGRLRWSTATVARKEEPGTTVAWRARWTSPTRAVALVVETTAPSALGTPEVTMAGGARAALDGSLAAAIRAPHWAYAGYDGDFAIYRNTRAEAPLTLRPVAGRTLTDASVHRRHGPALDPASATVSSPHGVQVVRAVAAITGWKSTWRALGGSRAMPLTVRRDGVVQVVTVPAGTGVVTWRYVGPGVGLGEALSGAAAAVLLLVVLLAAWSEWAARRGRRGRGPEVYSTPVPGP